jgi:hypothetical protein
MSDGLLQSLSRGTTSAMNTLGCEASLAKPLSKVSILELPNRLVCEALIGIEPSYKSLRADVSNATEWIGQAGARPGTETAAEVFSAAVVGVKMLTFKKSSALPVPKETWQSLRAANQAIAHRLSFNTVNQGTIGMTQKEVDTIAYDLKLITNPDQMKFMTTDNWSQMASSVIGRLEAFVQQTRPRSAEQILNPQFHPNVRRLSSSKNIIPSKHTIPLTQWVEQLKGDFESIRRLMFPTSS